MVALLWRRLDVPGHDACQFSRSAAGWQLDGTAVFRHESGSPAHLSYGIAGGIGWKTRRGWIRGFVGERTVDVEIERAHPGVWTINGERVAGLEAQTHLDFGFTPATNYPQLRDLNLSERQSSALTVAWLDINADGTPTPLQGLLQRYERRSAMTYWYESPSAGYAALLEVTDDGFIRSYPGLWDAIAFAPP